MSATAKLAAVMIALLAAVAGAMYVRALRAELAGARHELDGIQQNVADRDDTIQRLRQDAKDKAAQQAKLDRTGGAIASTLAAVQQENRRLTDENADLRAWAATPLPDDVVRLHTGPALTGAGDYVERMPAGEPVHTAGDGAADQR
jgi:LysB family phage lysis regulatory protein